MKNLTRAERHELASLLVDLRHYEATELQLEAAEAWADRLREEAGPVEPKSLGARFIAAETDSRAFYEWAIGRDGNWYVMNGSRLDGLSWSDLIDCYQQPSWTIEIYTPQEN